MFEIVSAATFFLFAFVQSAGAQVTEMRLNELREKYQWGSIYMTYIPLLSLNSILGKSYEEISVLHGRDAVSALRMFLVNHKGPRMNESVAFLQIDLGRLEAGFKKANDAGGVITRLPWSRDDVKRIADLSDRILTGYGLAQSFSDLLQSGEATVTAAMSELNKLGANPYVSPERHFLAKLELSALLVRKDSEVSQLKTQNPGLFQAVQRFKGELGGDLLKYQNFVLPANIASQQEIKAFLDVVDLLRTAHTIAADPKPTEKPY